MRHKERLCVLFTWNSCLPRILSVLFHSVRSNREHLMIPELYVRNVKLHHQHQQEFPSSYNQIRRKTMRVCKCFHIMSLLSATVFSTVCMHFLFSHSPTHKLLLSLFACESRITYAQSLESRDAMMCTEIHRLTIEREMWRMRRISNPRTLRRTGKGCLWGTDREYLLLLSSISTLFSL